MTTNIAVRKLVEFIMSSGSINAGFLSKRRMEDGVRTHKRVQRLRLREEEATGGVYTEEVKLKTTIYVSKNDDGVHAASTKSTAGSFAYCITGRADGVVVKKDGHYIVEEIKSCTTMPTEAPPKDHWHWGQVMCYAYMLCLDNDLKDISICLLFAHVETDEIASCIETMTVEELRDWIFHLVEKYHKWIEWDATRKVERNRTIQKASFPHLSYRIGQKKLAQSVYHSIESGKNFFIQAPTGTGKTISVLFPTIKAMGENLVDMAFYATAKTITRQVAYDALLMMQASGFDLSVIMLASKATLCPYEQKCNPVSCRFADGHFDRINDCVWEMMHAESFIDRQVIARYSELHAVCPHELALDASLWTDVVIGDYNHLFDPKAGLKRFFGEDTPDKKYAFLIDEAHNLVDRARDMFSVTLSEQALQSFLTAYKKQIPLLAPVVAQMIKHMTKLKSSMTQQREAGAYDLSELYEACMQFAERTDAFLSEHHESLELEDKLLSLYFQTHDFMRTFDNYSPGHTTLLLDENGRFMVKLFCMDPSYMLQLSLQKARASIFFSATLTPIDYFRSILGGKAGDHLAVLSSPFPKENRRIVVCPHISTYYNDRAQSVPLIAAALHAMIEAKSGHYFAFFPSYAYLDAVYAYYADAYSDSHTICQPRSMTEADKSAFLDRFYEPEPLLAFAVMGGMFGEGIDLPGDRLIGSAIIGVGLPMMSFELDLIKAYFDGNGQDGFAYAYQYPGMNKVSQAAGRVIRTHADRGIILLLDSRFLTPRYTALFPKEWYPYHIDKTSEAIASFWDTP